jgi:APA family basic amino acid/polyamine antiporter
VWIIGGLYALLGAVSLAELGAMIPESGGQTVFVRRAFGKYPGFVVAWSDWISTAASAAAVTIVFVEAVLQIGHASAGNKPALAVLTLLVFFAIQWKGIKAGSNVQLGTSAIKAFAFIALMLACFGSPNYIAQPVAAFGPNEVSWIGFILALQAVIYTYDGWSGAAYFSGEMENPGRDVPRSMISGVLSVIVIYLLLNLAFVKLIPLNLMAGDPLVADTAAKAVFGVAGANLVRALIAISLLSAINAILLMGTRVLYAMGASKVNAGGTPTTSLIVTTAVAIAFVLSGTFNQVIGLAAFFFVVDYAASFAAVFYLRRREPDTARPYRAWGYPVTTAIALMGSLAFLGAAIVADRRGSLIALALLVLSYPVHRWVNRTS